MGGSRSAWRRENLLFRKTRFLITCEHAGNEVPAQIKTPTDLSKKLLSGHSAYDIGAFAVAREMAKRMRAGFFFFTITRLLIDANRTFAKSKPLAKRTSHLNKSEIAFLKKSFNRYRDAIFSWVKTSVMKAGPSRVVAVSVHSFTPIMKGKTRQTDIGILFRPKVEKEVQFARAVRKNLRRLLPGYRIHFNRPYRGFTDCFINDLSDRYLKNERFVGVFFELNQKRLTKALERKKIARALAEAVFHS
jgi:predicted N-formylglutamate amidohydrolase